MVALGRVPTGSCEPTVQTRSDSSPRAGPESGTFVSTRGPSRAPSRAAGRPSRARLVPRVGLSRARLVPQIARLGARVEQSGGRVEHPEGRLEPTRRSSRALRGSSRALSLLESGTFGCSTRATRVLESAKDELSTGSDVRAAKSGSRLNRQLGRRSRHSAMPSQELRHAGARASARGVLGRCMGGSGGPRCMLVLSLSARPFTHPVAASCTAGTNHPRSRA